uniref:Uncharacterized protein n=1 Tax=Wuchereria bancrofti TaxID=6293 RepID=A0AAF5PKI4_WUCBA
MCKDERSGRIFQEKKGNFVSDGRGGKEEEVGIWSGIVMRQADHEMAQSGSKDRRGGIKVGGGQKGVQNEVRNIDLGKGWSDENDKVEKSGNREEKTHGKCAGKAIPKSGDDCHPEDWTDMTDASTFIEVMLTDLHVTSFPRKY